MKKFTIVCLSCLLFSFQLFGQATARWVNDFGTHDSEHANQICAGDEGNCYVAGAYSHDLLMCGMSLPIVLQPSSSNGTQNIFISKMDSMGNCIWRKVGISIIPQTGGVATAPEVNAMTYFDGYLYCAGVFTDSLIFDQDTLYNPTCYSGCATSFVLKLDPAGNIVWSKCFLGNSTKTFVNSIAPTSNGLLIAGEFNQDLQLDSVQLQSTYPFGTDGFLLMLNLGGQTVWATKVGQSLYGVVTDMAYDGQQGIYLSGNFYTELVFPSVTLSDTVSWFDSGSFIAKYDLGGNFGWAWGGSQDMIGLVFNKRLTMSDPNTIYFSGSFTDSVWVGAMNYLTPIGKYKDVLIKFDANGQPQWSKSTGSGTNFCSVLDGNSTGFVLFSAFVDTVTVGNTTYQSAGSTDFLLTQYLPNGQPLWSKQIGGSNQEFPKDVRCDRNDIYIAGRPMSNFSLDAFNVTNIGFGDALIAKLQAPAGPTEVQSTSLVFDGKVFPNPSTGSVTVAAASMIDRISITDLLGRPIFQTQPMSKEYDFQFLGSGIYFVTITSADHTRTKKVIVKE